MSSSSPRPEIYRTILHPALSVAVATTTLLAGMFLFNRLPGLTGPRPLTVVFVVIAPLIEAAVGNVLYAERAGIASRVRELVIYLLLAYAVFSLVRPGPFGARFSLSLDQLLPVITITVTWLYAFGIHNRLRGRESLLQSFHGKHGPVLRHALIDRQHDMAITVRELRATRRTIAAGFFILAALAILIASHTFGSATLPPGSAAFLLTCANAVVSIIAIGALNMFIDEYAANGVGLSVPLRFQRRRMAVAVLLLLVVVTFASALSRRESVFSLELIRAFFRWFGSLFDRHTEMRPLPHPVAERGPSYYEILRELAKDTEPKVPPLWIRLIAQLLRRMAVAIGAAAVTLLVFGPLFSREFRAGLKRLRPGQAAVRLWRRAGRWATIIARWIRIRLLLAFRPRHHGDESPAGQPGQASPAPAATWRPSLLKRRQMDRVATVFASVTRWGESIGLRYRYCEGAREYLSRVETLFPEYHEEIRLCAEIFWEARYSRHIVSLGRMRGYVRAARQITRAG